MDAQFSPATPVPTLSPEEMAARQRSHDERDARLLTALTILSAISAAFCLVLAFQVSLYSFGRHNAPAAQVAPSECTEGEYPSRCPSGEICQGGQCVPPGEPTRCEPGALCGTCNCDAPLACNSANVCTVPVTTGVCEDTNVLQFLNELQKKCGNARKCESKDLDKYAIAHEDFLNLMVQFPSTLALHFPDGQPAPLASRRWPSPEESAHYINRIRTSLDELKSADRILLVGLASKDRRKRDANANTELTLQRLIATQDLIYKAASSVLEPKEAEAIENKTSFIQLGDRRPIDARFYGNQYGNRPIAWEKGVEDQLRHLVEQGDLSGSSDDLRWRDRTLNQVVFVVPIPCKLSGA